MPRSGHPLEIHKFGGASLANGAAMAHAVSVIRAQRPTPLVVVVSAMAGVTDALLDLAGAAVRGDVDGARATLDRLVAQHRAAVAALVRAAPRADELLQAIEGAFAEVEPLAAGLRVLRELTPRTTDYLVARGEYLSARIVAAALDSAGCPALYVDAVEVIHTDGTFGNASPDLGRTERRARRVLRPLLARGVVPVVPGFLGVAPDGDLPAPHSERVPGQGALRDPQAGAPHCDRERHARRAGDRGARLRRGAPRRDLRLAHQPGVLRAVDLLQRPGGPGGAGAPGARRGVPARDRTAGNRPRGSARRRRDARGRRARHGGRPPPRPPSPFRPRPGAD